MRHFATSGPPSQPRPTSRIVYLRTKATWRVSPGCLVGWDEYSSPAAQTDVPRWVSKTRPTLQDGFRLRLARHRRPDVEVPRRRVMHHERRGRLLRLQLERLAQRQPDPLRLQQREQLRLV